ncbi:hypothetical protein DFH08DRAFT_1077868 [Mycena albidolilacea]|uniref:Uncharacterized protein n=1 Tax=Mycena albidolilacea TaxID=1033008 RepID=A0AAD7A8G6_9AGAR|nr:hypothetical protein DFH08DRAFT_1077868 [Mycena albidolilacea]
MPIRGSLLQDELASSLPSLESLIIVDFAIPKHLHLSTLPALRLLDVCIPPSSTHHISLMSVLLRPPAHRNLDIITIRINITIYAEEYTYTFDRFSKDAAALAALHPISRLDVHYKGNDHKKASMKSFFAADFMRT